MNSNVVIFLEPKGSIFEVIRAAHERGFKAIALSSYLPLIEKPPIAYTNSARLIDKVYPIDNWNDHAAIIEVCSMVAKDHGPIVGVYSGVDPCAVIAAKVRLKYGLPTTLPANLEIVLDKFKLREKLRSHQLSHLVHFSGIEVDSWADWKFDGAAYFKPTHGAFSAYVAKCRTLSEIQEARLQWRQNSQNDPAYLKKYLHTGGHQGYHLEESLEGELLSVEGMSSAGEFHCLGLLSRILYSKNPIVEMGSCFPYPHPLADQILDLVRAAHRVLGISDGPTHTEVIVDKHGRIEIIDLNPRFVGADVLQSINHAFDVKIENQLLNFAIGLETHLPIEANQYACLQYILPPSVKYFEHIDFPRNEEVKFSTQFLLPGTAIKSRDRQIDYLGCYLTVMNTFDEAVHRSRELRTQIKVNKTHEGVY